MCWNAKSSLSFFILGCILNTVILKFAIDKKNTSLSAFCIGWYFVLCMQLLEFIIWSNLSSNKATLGYITFLFNIFQLLVVYGVAISISDVYNVSLWCKIIAFLVLMFYFGTILFMTRDMTLKDYTVSTTGCHLPYPWWDHMSSGGLIYVIAFIAIFMLLFRPFYWALSTLTVILCCLLFSYVVYKPYVASMWCFFVVLVPVLSYFFSQRFN